jgi:hypothetical protein
MNFERADKIAKAVLYEGYMLYPYRPSSVKNRQRWNFGVVYPQAYSDAQGGEEPCSMQNEYLVSGNAGTSVEVRLRFLHLQTRSVQASTEPRPEVRTSSLPDGWQEAVEREISVTELGIGDLLAATTWVFAFPSTTRVDSEGDGMIERRQEAIAGTIKMSTESVGEDLFRVSVNVQNVTPIENRAADRDTVLLQSLVSTHTILGVNGGEFVSLLEPPAELQGLASSCKNVGAWPVLVGDAGQRDTMLASPIILYDYPQIAPESPGDLFDGTEIDEILSLRIMTLTDEEKREIRESDDRARQILERTDAMPVEQFMKLHGAMRSLRSLKEEAS